MGKLLPPEYHDHGGHFGGLYVRPGPWEVVEVDPNDVQPGFYTWRVYWVFGTKPDVVRGKHAHKKLDQFCICPRGACTFVLDNGERREEIRLDSPTKGLRIRPWVWREMKDFTPDCVLTVMASSKYDPDDYIRDYDDFLSQRAEYLAEKDRKLMNRPHGPHS
jgi:hypothetical protein